MSNSTQKQISDTPKIQNWNDVNQDVDKFGYQQSVNQQMESQELKAYSLDERNVKELPGIVYDRDGNEIGYVKYRSIKKDSVPGITAINIVPPGTILPYAGTVLPIGFLWCRGDDYSRDVYKKLYGTIGTVYGSSSATTFKTPDLKGRVIVGIDSNQAEFDTMGETSGAKTHTILNSEMSTHTHVQNSHQHNLADPGFDCGVSNKNIPAGGVGSYGRYTGGMSVIAAATTATNQNTGGGGAHNNLQPYMVLDYIIKF